MFWSLKKIIIFFIFFINIFVFFYTFEDLHAQQPLIPPTANESTRQAIANEFNNQSQTTGPGIVDAITSVGRGITNAANTFQSAANALDPLIKIISGEGDNCSIFGGFNGILSCFNVVAAIIFNILAAIATLAANLLDSVLKYLVFGMGGLVDTMNAITEAWKIFRDLSNIIFIFLLLWVSIRIILNSGAGGAIGQMIGRIIIVALFINFSLFISKAVIDSSNILALQFKDALVTDENEVNIGETLTKTFGLQTIYNPEVMKELPATTKTAMFVMGSIMLLVLIFAFLVASIMLVIRFIVLIFLMIMSPLAFIAYILPQGQKYASNWWHKLISESFYAPLFLMLLWVSVLMIQTESFQNVFGGNKLGSDLSLVGDGVNVSGAASSVINFIIVIGFLLASIIAGKFLGNTGGSTVVSYAKSFSKKSAEYVGKSSRWAGRETVGATASKLAETKYVKGAAANLGFLGRGVEAGLVKTSKNYRESVEKRTKERKAQLDRIIQPTGGQNRLSQTISNQRKRKSEIEERHNKPQTDLDEKKAEEHKVTTELRGVYENKKNIRMQRDMVSRLQRTGAPNDQINIARLKLRELEQKEISNGDLAKKIRERRRLQIERGAAERTHQNYRQSREYTERKNMIDTLSRNIEPLEQKEKEEKEKVKERGDKFIRRSQNTLGLSAFGTWGSRVNADELRGHLEKERKKKSSTKNRRDLEDQLSNLQKELVGIIDPKERQKKQDKIDNIKLRLYGNISSETGGNN